jgi:hypothetical protein
MSASPRKRRKRRDDEMWSLSQAIDHVQKSLGCDRETAWQALHEKLIAGEITASGIPMPSGEGYQDVQLRAADVRRQKAMQSPASDTPASAQSPPPGSAPRSR